MKFDNYMSNHRDREILIVRLISRTLELLSSMMSYISLLARNEKLLDLLMYSFLFICIFTSNDWTFTAARGELFRFDRFSLMGRINIYYLFGVILFSILFIRKIILKTERNLWGDNNYLKNIFCIYFIPVNLLIYFTIHIKDISVAGMGIADIVKTFIFVGTVFYIQDVFLKNKDKKQLLNILTVTEIIILFRCCYSLAKYYLGFGPKILERGLGLGSGMHDRVLRLGDETDFADFFILLFIIALTRLLFNKYESRHFKILHIFSVITSSYIIIMSLRRFAWGEYFIAGGLILFFHYHFNKEVIHKKIILTGSIIMILLSAVLYIGPDNLQDNYFLGRAVSILSIVDDEFSTEFGKDTHHMDEIQDGWLNVKNHWLLGVTVFGGELMERPKTGYQVSNFGEYSTFVHNNYLYVWLLYGLLGLVLLLLLYFLSLRLGYLMFKRFRDSIGLILLIYTLCQMVKNIVWHSVIIQINETIIFIFLVSILLKSKQLMMIRYMKNDEQTAIKPDSTGS